MAPHYAEIGGSPLLVQTLEQARALEARLGLSVHVAMRYSEPRAESLVQQLAATGVRRVVALPLYPQFSRTTSVSSLDELKGFAAAAGMEMRAVRGYPDHPGFIDALEARWRESAAKAIEGRDHVRVLFTAHGIPVRYARRGDPYLDEVAATARALRGRLPGGIEATVAYQSRLGPVRWAEPYLNSEIRRLAEAGTKRLVLFPITFVSEHLETLWELDIFVAGVARERGIAEVVRVPTVRDHPAFIGALVDLTRKALETET
jgi:ferrochelatase